MLVKVEVEIDYIEEDGSLDEEFEAGIRQSLVSNLVRKVEKNLSDEFALTIAKEANKIVEAKVGQLINTCLEQPITINKGWREKKEYESIYEMVEQELTALYQKGVAGSSCGIDPILPRVENYIQHETRVLLTDIEKKMNSVAKSFARKAVDENEFIEKLEVLMAEKS